MDGRYNFLMMGGDAGDDRTGRRPDSLSVLSVDAKTGQTAIISVPRNLQNAQFSEGSPMRQIYPDGYNCGDECLINAINTEVTNEHTDLYPGVADPGAQATLEAVSGTLGITVQAYVLVDMEGFAKLIDAMGGIRIKAGGWVPMSGDMVDEANGIHGMPTGLDPGRRSAPGRLPRPLVRTLPGIRGRLRPYPAAAVRPAGHAEAAGPGNAAVQVRGHRQRGHQGGGLQHFRQPARQLRGPGHEGQGQGSQPADHRAAGLRRLVLHRAGLRPDPREG